MVTENVDIARADAKSNSKSGDPRRWLRWLLMPSIIIVAISFVRLPAILGVTVVVAITIEVILSGFPRRRVMYACSVAVLLFASVFTLGIVGHTKSVPGAVSAMFSQGGEYGVVVTGDEVPSGDIMALIHKGDFERLLIARTTEEPGSVYMVAVELTYRTQSILGISALPPVADAIDSKLVISDYRQHLRGGIVGRVVFPITLVLGALPLACLVYMDRKNLFGRRIRR